jgi:hypothetical protein
MVATIAPGPAAGALQRRDADAEEVQDLLPHDREQRDDEQADQHRLTGQLGARPVGAAAGQPEEQRDAAERIHDHEQRDEDRAEQGRVEELAHADSTVVRLRASEIRRSYCSGSVVFAASCTVLLVPW